MGCSLQALVWQNSWLPFSAPLVRCLEGQISTHKVKHKPPLAFNFPFKCSGTYREVSVFVFFLFSRRGAFCSTTLLRPLLLRPQITLWLFKRFSVFSLQLSASLNTQVSLFCTHSFPGSTEDFLPVVLYCFSSSTGIYGNFVLELFLVSLFPSPGRTDTFSVSAFILMSNYFFHVAAEKKIKYPD